MSEVGNWSRRVCLSARRALQGQTPKSLRAYSFKIDTLTKKIHLRAHFDQTPSEDDLDDMIFVDGEIDADFIDYFETSTDIDIAPMGTTPAFLPGGIACLRDGEPGTCNC